MEIDKKKHTFHFVIPPNLDFYRKDYYGQAVNDLVPIGVNKN